MQIIMEMTVLSTWLLITLLASKNWILMSSWAYWFIKICLSGNLLGRRTNFLENLEKSGSSSLRYLHSLEFISCQYTSSCRWVILGITFSERRVNIGDRPPTLPLDAYSMPLHHKCTKKFLFTFDATHYHPLLKVLVTLWETYSFICSSCMAWVASLHLIWFSLMWIESYIFLYGCLFPLFLDLISSPL